jgi:peptidoglycan/LPS O-acetylase OafA/YrhL
MRALAVIAVMIYHANSNWLRGGFFGVEVFFVISGYLITLLLIAEKERSGRVDMKQFWIRRARRLLPALYTMLLLVTVWTALFKSSELGKLRGDVIAGLFYVSNYYQIWVGAGYAAANDFAPLRHLWSLAVEEQFYLIWPLVMVALLRNGSRRVADLSRWLFLVAVGVTVLVAVLYHPGPIGTPEVTPEAYWQIGDRSISKADTLYLGTISRSAGLLLGAAFAMIWRPVAVMRGPLRDKGRALDLVSLAGFGVLVLMTVKIGFIDDVGIGADAWLFRGGFFFASIATLGMIAAVTHERTVTSRVLAMPPLVWIGVRSYGLYLFSWPIYQMIRGIAGKKLTVSEFVLALVITLIVTEFSYRFIETPIRKGALGKIRSRLRSTRDPGRRNAVLAGAFAGTALTIFAAGSLATADLEQNEVEQSLDEGKQAACDVLADPNCTGATESTEVPVAPTTADASDTVDSVAVDSVAGPEITTSPASQPIARLAIGDSVMLGAAGQLAGFGFRVDAQESRGFTDGADYVAQLADADLIGEVVVVHLGTNGPINASSMQQMLDTLADVPQVLLVTNDADRDYTAGNNALIYDAVNSRPNVLLLDWQGNVSACPGNCLYEDEIHLRPDGQRYYALLVAGALGIS